MKTNDKRRVPDAGEVFVHRYKGVSYTLKVVTTEGGIGYELDGEVYQSPTAAAKAIVGQDQFVNGRKFWKIDDVTKRTNE